MRRSLPDYLNSNRAAANFREISMRILITGCNGLLGQKLLTAFHKTDFELIGMDLADESVDESLSFNYISQDLTIHKPTVDRIREVDPDIVIHTAAMTGVDDCETDREKCWKINVTATEYVVKAARRTNAKVIFTSSDYVFNGENGPYSENDPADPISYYGRSKLAGENVVIGGLVDYAIVRSLVLYGFGKHANASFLTWLLKMLRTGNEVRIVNDQWGNTTIAEDLTAGIMRIIDLRKTGVYNIAGRDFLSRFDFACKAADYFGLDPKLIFPITTAELNQSAPRPLKSGLLIDKAESELGITFRTLEDSFALYRSQEIRVS